MDIEDVARAVKQAQWSHHRGLDARLHEIGTTIVQWDALRAIDARPGASAHDLAQRTFQSDQAFATLATRLIRQGLVERSPGRGRRLAHHLTPRGEAMLADGRRIARTFFSASLDKLDTSERTQLVELLSRISSPEDRATRASSA